jgi:hypothetical protein
MIASKACRKCGRMLSLDHYALNRTAKDGHQKVCKDCFRKYREAHGQPVKPAPVPVETPLPSIENFNQDSLELTGTSKRVGIKIYFNSGYPMQALERVKNGWIVHDYFVREAKRREVTP